MSKFIGKVRRAVMAGTAVTVFLSGAFTASAAGLKDIFDAKYYADNNEDVKEEFGYDEELLYKHFLEHGLEEGRQMNPVLDVVAYRAAYEDLEKAFGDNWDAYVEHFLTDGVYETNRREGVLFDPLAYAEAYEDVREAYGDDIMAIIEHYETFGVQEGRTQGTADGYESIAARKEAESAAAAKSVVAAKGPRTEKVPLSNGAYNINEYDENGKAVKSTMYTASGALVGWEEYEYGENRKVKKTGYDGNSKLKYEYEYENNRLVKVTNYNSGNLSGYKTYVYDGSGKKRTENTYSAAGVLQKVMMSEVRGESGLYTATRIEWYDNDGNLSQYKTYTFDESGNKTENTYNAAGILNTVRVFDATGKLLSTTYYDAAGNVIQ